MLYNKLRMIEDPTEEQVLNGLINEYGKIMHTRQFTNEELRDIRKVITKYKVDIEEFFDNTKEM